MKVPDAGKKMIHAASSHAKLWLVPFSKSARAKQAPPPRTSARRFHTSPRTPVPTSKAVPTMPGTLSSMPISQ
jgi:hypothetical protein